MARPAGGSAPGHPPRHRRPRRHPALHRRPPQLRGEEAVRRCHRQPQPPDANDRVRLDARGAQPLPGQPPVRGVPRRPPPPRGAGGEDRRRGHLHVHPPQRRRRLRLVREAAREAHPHPERDRQGHPQGDQRAPRLPPQCRARLSPPRPHQRHAVGRREPAHPPRVADRLRPLRRPLRPRRALDRPPPEGQRPPPRNPQAPEIARQHRARRRA